MAILSRVFGRHWAACFQSQVIPILRTLGGLRVRLPGLNGTLTNELFRPATFASPNPWLRTNKPLRTAVVPATGHPILCGRGK